MFLAIGRSAGGVALRHAAAARAVAVRANPATLLRAQTVSPRGLLSMRMMATGQAPQAASAAASAAADVAAVELRRNRIMGTWLLTCGGMVFTIVVVGGLTRLTESGLSITEWKPVKGSIPPLTQADWEAEFDKYKKSPEYILENHDMSLSDFKRIFWWEWAHRQLGRVIGLSFVLPYAYFASKGWLRGRMLANTTAIGGLIGMQGLMGWLMVKSGLEERIVENQEVPRVSHYRLAAHLGLAFAIYLGSFWNGLTLRMNYGNDYKNLAPEALQQMRRFRTFARGAAGAVLLTAMSGALVAGLDAGMIYNEFPKMGNGLVPAELTELEPKWRNVLDNPATVQFDHRYLGLSTATLITVLWGVSRNMPLSTKTRVFTNVLAGVVALQVGLGISTLLSHVNIHVASAHQTGALMLLTMSTHVLHSLRNLPK